MFCRLCVNECTDYTEIFENKNHTFDISYLISSYLKFQVSSNDQYSTIVCQICLDTLSNFHQFCLSVESAQKKWQTKLVFQLKPPKTDHEINFENAAANSSEDLIADGELQINKKGNDNNIFSDNDSAEKKSDKSQLSKKFDRLIAENSNLKCHDCNEPMESFKSLKKHFKLTHNKSGYMICCKRKFFRAADFADHINLHLNPNYFKCNECSKCFSSRYSMDFHRKTCHNKEGNVLAFKCNYCSRKFLNSGVLDRHEKTHDAKEIEDQKHFCKQCNKSFPNESKLKSHNLNVHKTIYSRMCHLCGKTVRGNKALERHQLTHSGINPKVQCNICGAELSTTGILKAHIIALHPKDSNVTYKCSICGKNSPSQRALKNHMDYVHKCERIHKCNFCEKSFKKKQALKEHITIHTGDRLYECPHCPKTFKVRSNMHHHRKMKHPKEFQENKGKRLKT